MQEIYFQHNKNLSRLCFFCFTIRKDFDMKFHLFPKYLKTLTYLNKKQADKGLRKTRDCNPATIIAQLSASLIHVTILMDNGFFDYRRPVGFVSSDFSEFTLIGILNITYF